MLNFYQILAKFFEYLIYHEDKADETIKKYRYCLNRFFKEIKVNRIEDLTEESISNFKITFFRSGKSRDFTKYILITLRQFLKFCRDELRMQVLNPDLIKGPASGERKRRKRVEFLDKDELNEYRSAIDIGSLTGLRFRTLVEVMLGSGMRISEALSVDYKKIKWRMNNGEWEGETMIVGKGKKERMVFFKNEPHEWIKKYLAARNDLAEPLFVNHYDRSRLSRHTAIKYFTNLQKKIHTYKHLTSHICRKTYASNLNENGANIISIKDLLGHERIATTERHYIGVNEKQLKEVHRKYLQY
ncbi:MAG: tyrosine-type recombinase/integrase [Candidatus Portnoybacteria bacterium]|nr:tyrosine-type recombinase/integrase [Candidatus Portnoybacteria bacterium]